MDEDTPRRRRGRPRKEKPATGGSPRQHKITTFLDSLTNTIKLNERRGKRRRSKAFELSPDSPEDKKPKKNSSYPTAHQLAVSPGTGEDFLEEVFFFNENPLSQNDVTHNNNVDLITKNPEKSPRSMEEDSVKSIIQELQMLRQKNREARCETNKKLEDLTKKVEEESVSSAKKLAEIKTEIQKRDEAWSQKFEKLCQRVSLMEKNTAPRAYKLKELIAKEVAHLETPSIAEANPQLQSQLSRCTKWIEKQDKRDRKLNIIIKGLAVNSANLLTEVNLFFANFFGLHNKIVQTRMLNINKNIILATVDSIETKTTIFKSKREKLAGMQGVYIQNDLTQQERIIDFNIRTYAKKERSLNNEVRIGYQKIQINGTWFPWDKCTNKISKTPLLARKRPGNGVGMEYEDSNDPKN